MLTSRYPAISHTFIWRDVLGLRQGGMDVLTCSLEKPGEADLLTAEYRREFESTFYVKKTPLHVIAAAHLKRLFRSPARYFSSLSFALRSSQGGLKKRLWNLFYFLEGGILADWAEKNRIEHVFVHFAFACSSVAMYSLKMGGPAYTIRVHGSDIFYDRPGHYLKEKFADATALVCISDFCRSQVLCLLPPDQWAKVSVVRCGVNPQTFTPRPEQLNGRDSVVFLCVARLLRAKGLHFLLQACRSLRDKGIGAKCLLVGDGPAREELQTFARDLGIENHVEFTGSIGQDRIQEYYERADVFVLPSFAEGVPVVLIEAMAKELPVISTRIMGIPELVCDGVNGLLVPPANPEALERAMQQLAEDPALRRRFGKAAREKVVAEYNQETNVTKLTEILRRCVAAGPVSNVTEKGVHAG